MSVMFILLAIVALGVLIIVHEGGHFLVARLSGMRVDRFSIGFGPPLAKFRRGETVFQIGAVPLGGFVQIAGLNPGEENIAADDPRAYPNRPVYQRLLTIFAGPATNYLFAAILMAIVYASFGLPVPGKMPMVGELIEGAPAATAGVRLGDEVVTLNGKSVKDLNDVITIVEGSNGKPLEMVVLREGEQKTLGVTPRRDGDHWRIGVMLQPREVWVPVPKREAIVAGLAYPYEATANAVHSFALIFQKKQKAEFSGPVGIVKALKGQMARGPAEGLAMVAFISALLGFFNLLPVPALDGGRLVFLAYEGTLRRKFPQRAEQAIHMVGMFALFGFLLWVTVLHDLPRIFK
jgi:regulator of sigma E protease